MHLSVHLPPHAASLSPRLLITPRRQRNHAKWARGGIRCARCGQASTNNRYELVRYAISGRRAVAGKDTAPQQHGYVALPWLQWPRIGRRAGAGRDTAPQRHAHVPQTWLESPGGGRKPGDGRDTAPQHHDHVARPLPQSSGRGRMAGAGRGTWPQHHCYVAQPQWQWPGRGGKLSTSSGLGDDRGGS
jgi:hypothetical protein